MKSRKDILRQLDSIQGVSTIHTFNQRLALSDALYYSAESGTSLEAEIDRVKTTLDVLLWIKGERDDFPE